jgi:hypothetical protein
VLNEILGYGSIKPAPSPGDDGNEEIIVAANSTMILVVSPGDRVLLVDEAVDLLTRLGSPPALAVLVEKGSGGYRGPGGDPVRRPDASSAHSAL